MKSIIFSEGFYYISTILSTLWKFFAILLFYSTLSFFFYLLLLYLTKKEGRKKSKTKEDKVSIIIPCYNEEENIGKLLKHLEKLNYTKNKLEIIVVDDGSKDKTFEIAKKFSESLNLNIKVFKKQHSGKAASVNYGIKNATGKYIIVLDADTFPERNFIKKVLKGFSDKKVMAVVPILLPKTTNNIIEKMQTIEYKITNFIRNLLCIENALNVAPAASVFKKEFFEKHGYFDEGNVTEDLEIGMRILSKGYKIKHVKAIAYTLVPKNLKKLARQRIRWTYGFFVNIVKYKDLLFSPYFGDFGNFILPLLLFLNVVVSIFLIITACNFIINQIIFFSKPFFIEFDLNYYFFHYLFDFSFGSWIISLLSIENFMYYTSIIITVFYLYATQKIVKFRKKEVFAIILYYTVFVWLIVSFNLIGFIKFLLGKKVKW